MPDDNQTIIAECKKALTTADGESKGDLYRRMGDAHLALDQENRAMVCYREAFEAGREDVDFIIPYSKLLARKGDIKKAEMMIANGLRTPLKDMEKARLLNALSFCKRMRSNHRESMTLAEMAIDTLDGYRPDDPVIMTTRAEALHHLGVNEWRTGNFDRAIPHLKEAIALFTKVGDEVGLAESNNTMGNVHYHLGKMDEALDYWHASNNAKNRLSYDHNRCLVLIAKGQYDEAEKGFKEFIKLCKASGENYYVPFAYLNIADIYIERQNPRKALSYIEMATKAVGGLDHSSKRADIHTGLVQAHLLGGDVKAAEEELAKARAVVKTEKLRGVESLVNAMSAMVEARKGNPTRAKMLFERAINELEARKMNYELGKYLLEFARFMKEEGKQIESKKLAERARGLYRELGLDWRADQVGK